MPTDKKEEKEAAHNLLYLCLQKTFSENQLEVHRLLFLGYASVIWVQIILWNFVATWQVCVCVCVMVPDGILYEHTRNMV